MQIKPTTLFSYGKDVNFPDISVGNNTINETSVTKILSIHFLRVQMSILRVNRSKTKHCVLHNGMIT